MMFRSFDNIQVLDSVHDPRKPEDQDVYVKGKLYQVHIYLSGEGLPYVDSVTYFLHKTFKRSKINVQRTIQNPHCVLSIWTWGLFEVKALVKSKNGQEVEYFHHLNWDQDIDGNTQYIEK